MKTIYILLMLAVSSFASSCENAVVEPVQAPETPEISEQEANDLVFLREEEKLAYDVYIYAFEQYGQNIFKNISRSELSHTDAVLELIKKYNLVDPVGDNAPGVFINEDLQAIYTSLTARVDISEAAALEVGATIEDLDIYDIAMMQKNTSNADLIALYDNLICGSRNHLRAFINWLEEDYTPAYISNELFIEIINGEHEMCGSN